MPAGPHGGISSDVRAVRGSLHVIGVRCCAIQYRTQLVEVEMYRSQKMLKSSRYRMWPDIGGVFGRNWNGSQIL